MYNITLPFFGGRFSKTYSVKEHLKEYEVKLFAFTIDLEADYDGVVDKYEIFKEGHKIEEVLSALCSLDVKITVFIVGKIFELFPEVIKVFEKYNCEFEAHSYTHNFNNPDSEFEIEKAKTAYFNYFKRYPLGYRAPRGKISESGIMSLQKHGFLYDSSIFPSYFPDPFRYLFRNRNIHYFGNSQIMEIPITSLSPFRLTLSLSFIKLFGLRFYKMLSLPDVICFSSHLHDSIHNERSFQKLPLLQKLIYRRNKFHGVDLCVKFLQHVKKKGYRFCYMSEVYDTYKTVLT